MVATQKMKNLNLKAVVKKSIAKERNIKYNRREGRN